MVIGYDIIW